MINIGTHSYFRPRYFAAILLLPKVISSMLILLDGINIAAIMGESVPCTAKKIPTIL